MNTYAVAAVRIVAGIPHQLPTFSIYAINPREAERKVRDILGYGIDHQTEYEYDIQPH